MPLQVLDLFSGIGGFSLAARWAGMETVQFVEIEPFCQAVLRKNFEGVPIHGDITTFDAGPLRGRIDILCGGFPCQDISIAGKGGGLSGERSGLWFEMLRVIAECRPTACLIENVPALKNRGIDVVLGGLEAAGYSAEPYVVGADDIGASHKRKRVWIVAYARHDARGAQQGEQLPQCSSRIGKSGDTMADVDGKSRERRRKLSISYGSSWGTRLEPQGSIGELADPCRTGLAGRQSECGDEGAQCTALKRDSGEPMADTVRHGKQRTSESEWAERERVGQLLPPFPPARNDYRGWAAVASVDTSKMPCAEREVRRVASRLPRRLDGITGSVRNHRLKALGNAIVPQIAFLFLQAIAEIMK